MKLDLLLQRGEGDVVLLPARRLGPTSEGRHLSLVTSHGVVDRLYCQILFSICSLSGYNRKPPLQTSFWRSFPCFGGNTTKN